MPPPWATSSLPPPLPPTSGPTARTSSFALTPRARYGFIEALDFSPGRQNDTDGFARVDTFMAHHQGMSLVSIANVLLDGAPRTWMMANRHVQAVSSLLVSLLIVARAVGQLQ